ncbi:MAG: hypothetical protein LAP61_02945 [Acidobacteriia bacterium]|nr:hypothetical protein [Terriglobia bacterium]
MNEEEIRGLFREMREEPVPSDSLARVRAAVDQRIHQRPWLSAWKIAAAMVMASCIVAGFLLFRPAKTPVKVVDQPSTPEVTQVLPPPESPVRTAPRPRRSHPRPVESVPVSIRIETPDPDVVILLVN